MKFRNSCTISPKYQPLIPVCHLASAYC
jgi:hypothetical protein